MVKHLTSAAVLFVLWSGSVAADTVDITFIESGGNISITGGGSVDLTGLSLVDTGATVHGISPIDGAIGAGPAGIANQYSADPFTPYGTGGVVGSAPGTGDIFGLYFLGVSPVIAVPQGYSSGDPLAFTLEVTGSAFAGLGITGNVSYTTGNNTVNFLFGDTADVPLPPALPLLGAGLLALAFRRRSRRRQ